jgi:SAM-dependent methyltransferase
MKIRNQLNNVLIELKGKFPFPKYIDSSKKYEMNAILSNLIKIIPDFEGKRLLDIGSGPMDKTAVFQLFGFDCSAVDDLNDPWHKESNNTTEIKQFAKRLGIDFYHQREGDYKIPFKTKSFDVVCALAVIEHLHESPRNFLNKMGEFLKPDGILIITMPNSVNLRKRLSVLFGKTNHVPIGQFFNSTGVWRGHVREYTLSETVYICEEVGYDVILSKNFEQLAQKKLYIALRLIYKIVTSIIPNSRSHLLVMCKKPKINSVMEE